MAMTTCRECKETVSGFAKTCPHCGIKNPGHRWYSTVIVLGLIAFGIALAADNRDKVQPAVAQPLPATTPTPAPGSGPVTIITPSRPNAQQSQCGVTMDQYASIRTDMSYSRVASIIGCDGEETSRSESGGFRMTVYLWRGNAFASNMTAVFQNGSLVSKAQIGLK